MYRIAYLVDSTIPSKKANSVHAAKMSRSFSKIADITLFCREAEANTDKDEALKSYGVEKTFEIKTIPERKNNKLNIIMDGIKTYNLVKKQKKFDFIYGRSIYSIFFSRNIAPFMFESHEWPTNSITRNVQKIMFKSNKFKGLVTISCELKNKYLQEFPFLKDTDVHVLHDGADVANDFAETVFINNSKSKASDVIIGYLGHLYPGKCMEIVSQLAKIRPQYVFHIAGGTPELVSEWKNKLANGNISNVVMYGYIENKDADKWYKTFDVFLLPLQNNIYVGGGTKKNIGKWISPLKLFEAMSYGKAILLSDIPTLREVIDNGKDGIMVDPDDIDTWGDALDFLVQNREARVEMGCAARKKLESSYTWDIRAQRILEYFESK